MKHTWVLLWCFWMLIAYVFSIEFKSERFSKLWTHHQEKEETIEQKVFGMEVIHPPFCSRMCMHPSPSLLSHSFHCSNSTCGPNSFCFLGKCVCHPGYSPSSGCKSRLEVANPWYTTECPNLEKEETYREDIELEELGGWKNCSFEYQSSILSYCAHLCFSHPSYGVAAVPLSLWKRAQIAESNYWKNDHSGSDRGFEHVGAFLSYKCLPLYLGKVVEIGSGPWGQFREILRANPNVEVTSYTPWDPNAHEYLNNPSCSYRDGLHLIPLKNTPGFIFIPNYSLVLCETANPSTCLSWGSFVFK